MTAAASVTSTGTLVAAGCTLLGIHWVGGAVAGSVVLKDGGGSGTAKVTVNTPASAAAAGWIDLADGIPFGTDVHATVTNAAAVLIVYRANPAASS